MELKSVIPVIRIFDLDKALDFYRDYLGFGVDWEHRFEKDFPVYLQISRNDCLIHLTEHHGDATPGSAIRILTDNVDEFHQELTSKTYTFANPGVEEMPWGSREMHIMDPFGNHLIFATD